MSEKKVLLLTNDDGFESRGIRLLYDGLKGDYEVIIVAPNSEQSGVSHSFTYQVPLYYKKINGGYSEEMYVVSGSPADCVKIAVSRILPRKPDIVVSGFNAGENSGISAFYSGTVAAAREGAFWNIRSFAFSLCEGAEAFMNEYTAIAARLLLDLLKKSNISGTNTFYNINFPSCHPEDVKGVKITRQSLAFFDDRYEESIGNGRLGYLLTGKKMNIENSDEFDSRALLNNWIAITPHTLDSTAHDELLKLKNIQYSI